MKLKARKLPNITQDQLNTLADIECSLTILAHDIEESDGESIFTRRIDKIVGEIENLLMSVPFNVKV